MIRHARMGLALALLALAWPIPARGQGRRAISPPVVSSVNPPGVQVGTSIEWTLAGRGFSKVKRVIVSGSGVETVGFEPRGDGEAIASVRVAADASAGLRELRVEGPDGVSNLVLVRIDTLPQVVEVEPNDEPAKAQEIEVGKAVAGVLRATDIDHYLIRGQPGQRVTLDLEARRVGTSLSPVLTVFNRRGGAISQARESRSSDHDCRLAVTLPRDGVIVVQVRDNVYGGSDSATYRLRVTPSPYATGLFPLGGPKGKPLSLTISGGSLRKPLMKTIALPDAPGTSFDPGPFDGPDGPVPAPGLIAVGDEGELVEASRDVKGTPVQPIGLGQTVNGRLERRGEVDLYAMTVKKGDKFRVKVEAEPLGSWLDSVLTIRNKAGEALAENDDSGSDPNNANQRGVNFLGLSGGSSDSQVDFEAAEDGQVTVEVADRYGDGGPEYGYRLSVGATRPDFSVHLLIGNPTTNGQLFNAANNRSMRLTPGQFGVFNLAPGVRIPVNFVVVPQGRPGPVTVRVEGLPDGVTVAPVKVDVLGPGKAGGQPSLVNAPPRADNLVFDVASHAEPGLSEVRIVAEAEPAPGVKLTRVASATIGLDAIPSNVPSRPITRTVDRFPLRVVGEPRPTFVGPPPEPTLTGVRAAGVLLQGDRIDLSLDFDAPPLADPGFTYGAKAKGAGLSTNTVISSGSSPPDSDAEPRADVLVRVLASPRVVPGVYPVEISHAMTGGKPQSRDVLVIVRQPVEVLVRTGPIAMKPGGTAELWVGLRREIGAESPEIEIKLEGLPDGVKPSGPATIRENEAETLIKLEMSGTARSIANPAAVKVVAVVQMPRGNVSVESRNRPMIVAAKAED
jgi:hypothetical protein